MSAVAMLGAFAVTGTAMAEDAQSAQGSVSASPSDGATHVGEQTLGASAPAKAKDARATEAPTGSLLVGETFSNTNFAVAKNWVKAGSACLTAGQGNCKKSTDSSDIQGVGDGKGYLQLTDNSESQSGAVLYNQAIPSRQGLDITFTEYMYHKTSQGPYGDSGADGMSFFLTDGGATLSKPGAAGAGLGYASKDDNVTSSRGDGRSDKEEGVAQGVLGVGLDMFGNFSKEGTAAGDREVGGESCPAASGGAGDSVTLRGAGAANSDGKWMDGYCRLITRSGAGLATDAATAAKDDTNGKTVRITISPLAEGEQYQTVTVWINGTLMTSYTLTYTLPTTVKFGFSASTGGNHQVHLVRGLTAYSVNPLTDISVTKLIDKDKLPNWTADYAFKSGETVPYKFTVTNGGEETLTNVEVKDPLVKDVKCPNDWDHSLAKGGSVTCTGSLTLSDAQAAAGSLTNTVTATGQHDGAPVSATDSLTVKTEPSLGTPAHRKWVEKVAGTDDTYRLNLSVTGGGTSSSTTATKADVVVVLDKSGSMDYKMDKDEDASWYESSRLDVAQTAIKSMSSQLLSEGYDVRMSLVTFSGSRGDSDRSYNDASIAQTWTDSKNTFDNAVDGVNASGGTNWQAGFLKAGELLGSARDGAEKYVVFLSDGAAGYYYNDNGSTTGSGNSFNQTAYDKAVQAAQALNLPVSHIWSVGVSTASDSDNMSKLAAALSGTYLDGSSEDDLKKVLDSIAQTITSSSTYTIQSIQDTLSGWVEPAGWSAEDVSSHVEVYHNDQKLDSSKWSASYDADSKQVKVTFDPAVTAGKDDTYRIAFNVKPNDKAYERYADSGYESGVTGDPNTGDISAGKRGFHTNASASVSYCVVSSTTGGNDQTDCKDAGYAKPVIPVVKASIRVVKRWVDASGKEISAPEGVKSVAVSLKQGGEAYADGSLTADGPDGDSSETGDNWSWSRDVAAGSGDKTYTVEETVPDGWTPSYSVVVSGDGATADKNGVTFAGGKAGQSATITITNSPAAIDFDLNRIQVRKTVTGVDSTDQDFAFTLTPTTHAEGKDNNDRIVWPNDGDKQGDVSITDAFDAANKLTRTVPFGSEALKLPAREGRYVFEVAETEGDARGWAYDTDKVTVTVTVAKDDSGKWAATVSYGYAEGDSDKTSANADVAAFTNRWVAVSSLPLTGGSTDRQWLAAGLGLGGMALLLVGAMGVWRNRRRVL